ncbi:hypothetical protein EXS72_01290 [Candidatus Pacearchaeota archaeon]|nr:hypothetical protein [Candidatus Pacearchaeota archaeon]
MQRYNRIGIIGGSGSGKTHLAQKLSKILKIKNYELDDILWAKKYTLKISKSSMIKILKKITTKKRWIIDRVSSSWIAQGIKKSELVILLKIPSPKIIWRLFLRHLECRIKKIPETWKDFIDLTKFSIEYNKGNHTSLRHQILIKKHKLNLKVVENKRDCALLMEELTQ